MADQREEIARIISEAGGYYPAYMPTPDWNASRIYQGGGIGSDYARSPDEDLSPYNTPNTYQPNTPIDRLWQERMTLPDGSPGSTGSYGNDQGINIGYNPVQQMDEFSGQQRGYSSGRGGQVTYDPFSGEPYIGQRSGDTQWRGGQDVGDNRLSTESDFFGGLRGFTGGLPSASEAWDVIRGGVGTVAGDVQQGWRDMMPGAGQTAQQDQPTTFEDRWNAAGVGRGTPGEQNPDVWPAEPRGGWMAAARPWMENPGPQYSEYQGPMPPLESYGGAGDTLTATDRSAEPFRRDGETIIDALRRNYASSGSMPIDDWFGGGTPAGSDPSEGGYGFDDTIRGRAVRIGGDDNWGFGNSPVMNADDVFRRYGGGPQGDPIVAPDTFADRFGDWGGGGGGGAPQDSFASRWNAGDWGTSGGGNNLSLDRMYSPGRVQDWDVGLGPSQQQPDVWPDLGGGASFADRFGGGWAPSPDNFAGGRPLYDANAGFNTPQFDIGGGIRNDTFADRWNSMGGGTSWEQAAQNPVSDWTLPSQSPSGNNFNQASYDQGGYGYQSPTMYQPPYNEQSASGGGTGYESPTVRNANYWQQGSYAPDFQSSYSGGGDASSPYAGTDGNFLIQPRVGTYHTPDYYSQAQYGIPSYGGGTAGYGATAAGYIPYESYVGPTYSTPSGMPIQTYAPGGSFGPGTGLPTTPWFGPGYYGGSS